MRKMMTGGVLAALLTLGLAPEARAHCEIPCGIYGDGMRFDMIVEDLETIQKSMAQIQELQRNPQQNMNQIVRWVMNKERHADHIREIITDYFMAQRVKPAPDEAGQKAYLTQLELLHRLLVLTMKMKQTTDLSNIRSAQLLLRSFRAAYLGKEGEEHLEEHHKQGEKKD